MPACTNGSSTAITLLLIIFPTSSSKIAPYDTFDGHHLQLVHEHDPTMKYIPMLLDRFRHLVNVASDEVIWTHILQKSMQVLETDKDHQSNLVANLFFQQTEPKQ